VSETLVVVQRRGRFVETEHPVCAVLCDASGAVLRQVGPPIVSTWRSAAKPFQLEATAGTLAPEAVLSLTERELALGAASHSGEPRHTEAVTALLARFGLTDDALHCGAHWPMHEPSKHTLIRAGRECCPLHNNCSGKHTYMAASARALGAPADYRPADHAVQLRVRANVDRRTGGAVVDTVMDGCGVPCFVLPISGMARAWAELAQAIAAPAPSLLGRIGRAMAAEPWWMSGTGRQDLSLIEAATRPLVTKIGAAGILCAAIPDEGLGLALKVTTGDGAARAVAMTAVLQRFLPGLIADWPDPEWPLVRSVAGLPVGSFEAVWKS
jgi:L-asparaginase II